MVLAVCRLCPCSGTSLLAWCEFWKPLQVMVKIEPLLHIPVVICFRNQTQETSDHNKGVPVNSRFPHWALMSWSVLFCLDLELCFVTSVALHMAAWVLISQGYLGPGLLEIKMTHLLAWEWEIWIFLLCFLKKTSQFVEDRIFPVAVKVVYN